MRRMRLSLVGLLGWLTLAAPALAAEPRSPLTLLPDVADLVLVVPAPAKVLDAITTPALFQKARELAPIREFLEGTSYRRFQQLIAYLEREMGMPAAEILDRVAGGGVALGTKFGANPAPALAVVQGRDARASERFFGLLVQILEQELARQENAPKLVKGSYQGITGATIGNDIFLGQSGTTLLLTNKKQAMTAAVDLLTGKSEAHLAKKPAITEARQLLAGEPLAWLWLNMETVRSQNPTAAELYKTPREPLATMIFGSYFDILGRTPYLAMGLHRERDDFTFSVRAPVGRDGMGPDRLLHVGPDGRPASRPLLEPRGVLFSTTLHLDLAAFWNDRAKIFGADVVSGLEQADKNLGQFPFNRIRLSKLLTATAPYHRFVVVNQPKGGYTKQPQTPIPAFAVVTETLNDDYAGGIETLIRGAGLALSTQIKLKLKEEKIGDVTLIGYRVDEARPLPNDVQDLRFGFSPCFARVGKQVLLCSTIEVARELVPLLQAEKPGERSASVETRFYGSGFAELLALQEEQLVTQAILDQAIPAKEAREQIREFLALLRSTGGVSLRATFAPKQFDYQIRFRLSDGK